jgi:hypothetical protein
VRRVENNSPEMGTAASAFVRCESAVAALDLGTSRVNLDASLERNRD